MSSRFLDWLGVALVACWALHGSVGVTAVASVGTSDQCGYADAAVSEASLLQHQTSMSSSSLQDSTVASFVPLQIAQQSHRAQSDVDTQINRRQQDVSRLAAELERAQAELAILQDVRNRGGEALLGRAEGHAVQQPDQKEEADKKEEAGKKLADRVVPVAYFLHDKDPPADWKHHDGLPNAHHASTGGSGHAHSHGYIALLFLAGALVIGSILFMLLKKYAPAIPYTSGLFIVGALVSWIHWINGRDRWKNHPLHWDSWYDSVEIWEEINPHMLLYVFLPALLFGDVLKTKVQLAKVCSGQILLLACPGVFFGTFFTALLAWSSSALTGYEWSWNLCLLFGAILAATDPVAVVSLFNTLGVSPKLTMLVSGESLVNDGTAIVCFMLAKKLVLGIHVNIWDAVIFFFWMTLVAIIVGFIIGSLSVVLINFSSEDHHGDVMIQVVTTMCCGYLAFFMAESEMESSGVIGTVTAGLVVAYCAWPLFVSREQVLVVWEAVEFIGNTVIFFLAGLIFMGTWLESRSELNNWDWIWLILLFVGIFIIRAAMMAVFWIPMNSVGSPLSWQEGVAMVWSGLRGAVSIAMALMVYTDKDVDGKAKVQMMFHVGGIATLTLLVNSVTMPRILKSLGLVESEGQLNRLSHKMSARIVERLQAACDKHMKNPRDVRFNGVSPHQVSALVPAIQAAGQLPKHGSRLSVSSASNQITAEWRLVHSLREIYLRVVQQRYWQSIDEGVVLRRQVSRLLLHSVEECLDDVKPPLDDWDIMARLMGLHGGTMWDNLMSKLSHAAPFKYFSVFRHCAPEYQLPLHACAALSYIEAHTHAENEIPTIIGAEDDLDIRVQNQVLHESGLQRQKANEYIQSLPIELVGRVKSEMLSRRLLRQQLEEVEHMREEGFLSDAEARYIAEPCEEAYHNIARLPPTEYYNDGEASQGHSAPASSYADAHATRM